MHVQEFVSSGISFACIPSRRIGKPVLPMHREACRTADRYIGMPNNEDVGLSEKEDT